MNTIKEFSAAFLVLLSLIGVPSLVSWYEKVSRSSSYESGIRIITLTGVAREGVWTTEEVAGYNYWRRHFPRASIRVRVGEKVLLRLKSADVTHYFYCPKLGIERVEVKVGHVEEVTFTAETPGTYVYSCEAICGKCHYYMRGVIEILPRADTISTVLPGTNEIPICPHDLVPPVEDDPILQGEFLYRKLGCIACHEGPGVGRNINVPPDLRYEGSKVKAQWLVAFLLKPTPLRWRKEGARPFVQMPNFHQMPNFNLTETQISNLAAYLLEKIDKTLIPRSGIDWDSPASPEEIEEGHQLYKQYQCQGCHQLGGVGRKIGPSHDSVGSRLRPDYMYEWVLDPQKIIPGTPMPNKGLWEGEARALVRYLQTLNEKAKQLPPDNGKRKKL